MAKKNEKRYGTCQNPECMNYGMSEVIPDDGNCPICHKPMKSEEDSNDGGDVDLDNIEDIPFEERKKTKGIDSKLIAIIVAAVLVLAGAGFGIWKAFGESDPMDEIAKIKLDKKNITLVVGQRDVIKATVVDKDGKEITDAKVVYKWTAKDEKVASVTQGGEVAALKKGKTSVTVKIEGDDKHRATCKVEVKVRIPGGGGEGGETSDVLITNLSVANSKISLKEGEQAEIKLTVEPSNHTENISMESSDSKVAVIEDGIIKAKKAGSANILVKTEKSGKSVTINVTVSKKDDEKKGPYVGTLKLSYGTYTGRIENGYPNGQGKLVYKTTRQISRYDSKGRTAQAGESVQGTFKNGFFTFGKHYDANGNLIESLNIGSPVEGVYESK